MGSRKSESDCQEPTRKSTRSKKKLFVNYGLDNNNNHTITSESDGDQTVNSTKNMLLCEIN